MIYTIYKISKLGHAILILSFANCPRKSFYIKQIFCDKCNTQFPGEHFTLVQQESETNPQELIASVEFKEASFSPDKIFQEPAKQIIKINHELWRAL